MIKHLKIYNSNYFNALEYVLFQHNESTGEPVLDWHGNKIMRDEVYLDGINCEPYSFSAECEEVNRRYRKNNKRGEIKEHHFIISYDPKDVTECELTGPKAQELSMEFARRCLPGFQILVCTHMDGHNRSGNIHTHLICNSVRKHDIGVDCYAERPGDRKAGNKLHLTLDYLDYMKREVMSICRREGLNQVDLLSPAAKKQNDREYYARKRGQDKMDDLIEVMNIEGIEPTKTIFQTEKDYLREGIRKVAMKSGSFEEFKTALKSEYMITLKESRGRWSYLHPKRTKYITGRALGSAYEKEALLDLIASPNKHWGAEAEVDEVTNAKPHRASPKLDTIEDCRAVFVMCTNLRLVVDLQTCAKAQDNLAYSNKVKLSNLQKMAETILFVQENGFNSLAELEDAYDKACAEYDQVEKEIMDAKSRLKSINERIHYTGQYYTNRPVYLEMLTADDKGKYLAAHRGEIMKYNQAETFLKNTHGEVHFPLLTELRAQKKDWTRSLNYLETQRVKLFSALYTFQIVTENVQIIMRREVFQPQMTNQSKDVDLEIY